MMCFFCGNRLVNFVFLLVCATCKKAWQEFEYIGDVRAAQEQKRKP